jgi:hypothetical protein
MRPEDKYFEQLTQEELWKRYCGFLDLSVAEFMGVQEQLLLDQIDRVWSSTLGRKVMGDRKPVSMEDFRALVPLTTYDDYEPYLSERREDALACKPALWCHSSGRMGQFKWFPHSPDFMERVNKSCLSALTLACTRERGRVNYNPGFRFLLILPPTPYTSGCLFDSFAQHFTFRAMPPQDTGSNTPFQQRVATGFQMALRDGVDVIGAIASVLVKMGEQFEEHTRSVNFSPSMLHPSIVGRMTRAWLRAKREHRPILPRDLWPSRAIATGGVDTAIYKQAIERYWGSEPYEFYTCAEGFLVAIQGWNKKGLYFLPDIAFYEFIPHAEVLKWQADDSYQPSTVLYNEVQEGELYEVVITQLYGMPLLRYRMKDLVRFTGLHDDETGVRLPHMQFQRRVGETIDLAALARLDERTLWQAVANTGLRFADWAACKEYDGSQAYLRLYLEPKDECTPEEVAEMVDRNLKAIDVDYRDIESYLGLQPVKVTLLPRGSFQRYMDRQRAAGADLAHLKPPHINPSERALSDLMETARTGGEAV